MKLVIITKGYNSSVTNKHVEKTLFNSEGKPMYAIYLSNERAQTLIDAGVAEEYVVDDSNSGTIEVSTTEEDTIDVVDNINEVVSDEDIDGNVKDENPNADDSNKDEVKEQTIDTKSKSDSKKKRASK